MTSNLRIISIRDFIKLTPQGHTDLATLKQAITQAASVSGAFTDYDVLVDTRGTEPHLSVFDLWELAEDLAKLVHAGSAAGFRAKIPILCAVDRFDLAKFFELTAQNRGLNVRAFTSVEDLFEWLSKSSTPSLEKPS